VGEAGAVPESRSIRMLQDEFGELRKRYWGQHLWARGDVCATVCGADEKTIRDAIENQRWEEDGESFKITSAADPQAASSRAPFRRLQPQPATFSCHDHPAFSGWSFSAIWRKRAKLMSAPEPLPALSRQGRLRMTSDIAANAVEFRT